MSGYSTTEVQSTDPQLQEIEQYLSRLLAEERIPAASTKMVAEEIDEPLRVTRRRLFKLEGRGIVGRKDGPAFVWYLTRTNN